jgi:hypothetical protein
MVQSVDAEGTGLRVVFVWRGDRWGHVITAIVEAGKENEKAAPILISREGSADEPWPPSPPLQSLSIEQRASGAVALLVGMAGRSHWSLSVEGIVGASQIRFDAAARLSGEPSWLGSVYLRGAGSGEWLDGRDPLTHCFATGAGAMEVHATCGGFGGVFVEEIELQPLATSDSLRRWSYTIGRFSR